MNLYNIQLFGGSINIIFGIFAIVIIFYVIYLKNKHDPIQKINKKLDKILDKLN